MNYGYIYIKKINKKNPDSKAVSWVSEAWSRRHINHLHSQNCSAHISGSHHSHSFCCSFPFMNPEKVKEPRSRRRDWSPWKPTEHQQPPLYSCRLFTMAAGSVVSLPPCSSGFIYISLSLELCVECVDEKWSRAQNMAAPSPRSSASETEYWWRNPQSSHITGCCLSITT